MIKIMTLGILMMGCACYPKKVQQTSNQAPKNSSFMSSCEMKAMLEKHPDDEGVCSWILILDEGERVLLQNPDFLKGAFSDGGMVKIGFKWMKSDAELCHRAEAVIKLECIELLNGQGQEIKGDCVNTIDVFDIPWMNDIMIKMNPLKIIKYSFGDNLAYRFIKNDMELIYDCFGNLLCEEKIECGSWMSELKNPKVILVVDYNE